MFNNVKIYTVESVTSGHPDKMCDQISDAILDECLSQDPNSRVAVETFGGHGLLLVGGEVTTKANIDFKEVAKRVYREIGHQDNLKIMSNIVCQSPDIAQGVNTGGAGDQGIMVGYACNENEEMIPQELYLARSLCKFIYDAFPEDGKTQITLNNEEVQTIVASFCNVSNIKLRQLIEVWLQKMKIIRVQEILVNPAGEWNIGGFDADTGMNGRKIVCDAYGPQIPVGGGCLSSKDPSKVDRSGAYMARYIATDILKDFKEFETHTEVFVKLAYAIGLEKPVMAVYKINDGEWYNIEKKYDCTPKGIIKKLDLKQPIYESTACWGAFGNGFKWDNMN